MTNPEEKKTSESRIPLYFTIVFTLVMLLLQASWMFLGLDNKWVDNLFHWRGMDKGDPRIVIVEIDDASLKKVGQFPFRRSIYAELMDKLYSYGVSAIALDVLFVEPSTPQEDQALIAATKKAGDKVVHAVMIDQTVVNINEFIFPFKKLNAVTKSAGHVVQSMIDSDGSVRNTPLVLATQDHQVAWDKSDVVPALGLKLLANYEKKAIKEYEHIGESIRVNFRGESEKVIGTQIVGGEKRDIVMPIKGFWFIPIWKILNDELSDQEKEKLKNTMVLVGSTAVGYFDHYPNPFTEMMPGVLVHANLIDNILHKRYLRNISVLWSLLLICVMAIIAYFLLSLGPLQAFLLMLGILISWAVTTYLFFVKYYVLDFSAPAITLAVVFVVLTVYKVMSEQKQKRAVRQMFGQYVSPEVVDILVQDPSKIRLGGQKRDMTMFFLDIAHFTTISEKMAPENLIKFLNHYLTALTDDVLQNHGVVDKYIGDCIMAFWNAPLSVPEHRKHACLAAISCVDTIKRLNKDYVDSSMPEAPAVRIGLNSGEVIVGNTGSARKLAYTVLGDEVNLASRLEGANKFFGSTVMVSEDTFNGAKEAVEGRELGRVRVVGKDVPIRVYELLGKKEHLTDKWKQALPDYCAGLEYYVKRDFEKAKASFDNVIKVFPDDKPTKLYLNSCEDYIVIPPPKEWDGVFNLTTK